MLVLQLQFVLVTRHSFLNAFLEPEFPLPFLDMAENQISHEDQRSQDYQQTHGSQVVQPRGLLQHVKR